MDLEKADIIKDYLEYKGWTDSEIERFIYNENIDESYEKIIEERAQIDIKNRIKNSLRAFIIGDALGVPFESQWGGTFKCTGFVGGGIHQKEAGTWSDDTSVMLCLLDALNKTKTMRSAVELLKKNLKDWYYDGKFTADGDTFDVGRQTAAAIECDFRNDRLTDRMGNGALFYTPIVFHFLYREFKIRDFAQFSRVTHNSEKCFYFGWEFCKVLKSCILGYGGKTWIKPNLQNRGDIENTYFWVLAHYVYRYEENSLIDCLCDIINRGGDTDTNAALLGLLLGSEKFVYKEDWEKIRNHEFADRIINDFVESISYIY